MGGVLFYPSLGPLHCNREDFTGAGAGGSWAGGCPLWHLLGGRPTALFCAVPPRDPGSKRLWSLAGCQEDLFGVGQGTESPEPQFLHMSNGGHFRDVWDAVVAVMWLHTVHTPGQGPP